MGEGDATPTATGGGRGIRNRRQPRVVVVLPSRARGVWSGTGPVVPMQVPRRQRQQGSRRARTHTGGLDRAVPCRSHRRARSPPRGRTRTRSDRVELELELELTDGWEIMVDGRPQVDDKFLDGPGGHACKDAPAAEPRAPRQRQLYWADGAAAVHAPRELTFPPSVCRTTAGSVHVGPHGLLT